MDDSAFSSAQRPQFNVPIRQIFLMAAVLILTAAVSYIAYPRVETVFLSNPYLNGLIVAVFVIGVLACFWQVFQLINAARWLEAFAHDPRLVNVLRPPGLLAPMAGLLRGRGSKTQIGATSSRSILDSVATRLDETRDITRYIVNLLIFLGLLGTFFGLATTVPAVVETIRSLAPAEGEGGIEVFSRLMGGLEKQLGGMGIAFASSLLGLSGSLVVGLLELFAGHGQNRFFRELEEWLSTITRVGFASGDTEGGGDASVAAQVMDHMVAQMDNLQDLFLQGDAARTTLDEKLISLTASVERMTAKMDRGGDGGFSGAALDRIAMGQERVIQLMEAQHNAVVDGEHVDAESRMRLRSIDVQLLRILEEMAAGRQESVAELRGELASLNRAMRQAAGRPTSADQAGDYPAAVHDDPTDPAPVPRRPVKGQG